MPTLHGEPLEAVRTFAKDFARVKKTPITEVEPTPEPAETPVTKIPRPASAQKVADQVLKTPPKPKPSSKA